MTGTSPRINLDMVLPQDATVVQACSIRHTQAYQLICIERLKNFLDTMHKNLYTTRDQTLEMATDAHNRRINVIIP